MAAQKTVLIIAGPTAVGKTGIAISVAEALDTSIISADSRQCYQGMRIGTAQPTPQELARVPHYFVDVFPVAQPLNAADFEHLALGYLETIFKEKDVAIVCGGTGLYLRALTDGLDDMPPVDEAVSTQITKEYAEQGLGWLQTATQAADPLFMAQADGANPARLLRALIFQKSTGESILKYQSAQKKQRPFQVVKVGLELPREVLYNRINIRVDGMMAEGFLKEATDLYPQRQLKNLQTVGYSELFDYLDGQCTLERAVALIQQHSRNYAKRQLTWFKKDVEMQWLRADDEQIVSKILALLPHSLSAR